MDNKRFALLLATIALAGTAWPDPAARIAIEAAPAVAAIEPLPAGRSPLRLPALDFELEIHASCGPDRVATAVSISAADTRRTLVGEQVQTDSLIAATLRLPAPQLSPVAVDDFCRAPSADVGAREMLIRGAATAHVSLRCAGDTGESISYASKPLDVTLVCDERPDDQGDASTATDR